VEVSLPPNASATVNGHTRNGDILVSGYPLTVSGDETKTVTGRIGSGGAKIVLSADNGDLRIKQGTVVPAEPSEPALSKAPHLKAQKAPPQAVTQ
jgi:hypothetical protein